MAIDLPPVMPPQLASQVQIEAHQPRSAAIEQKINGVLMRVYGNKYLSTEQVTGILAAAETPSAAITALTRRYYNLGHLLVAVHYYRQDDTVHVLVEQNTVKGLRGNPRATAFFDGLVGDPDLQLEEFDRARVLADVYAERAGVEYSISYEQHYDNAVILDFIESPSDDYDANDAYVEINNQGSRFLGRYFGELGGSQRFSTGTEFRLGYRTAFTDFGEASDGDDFHRLNIALEQPMASGLYTVEASHIRYEREPTVSATAAADPACLPLLMNCDAAISETELSLDARISSAALRGEHVLYSNPVRRLSLFERVEYIDSRIEARSSDTPLLEERYATLEVGGRYSLRDTVLGQPSFARLQLAGKIGLSGSGGSFESDDGNGVGIGRRSADFFVFTPAVALRTSLANGAELSLNALGQWNNSVQLPQQQQWVLGGIHRLAAWLPGTLIGDEGFYARLALQKSFDWNGVAITPAVFTEYGSAWFQDTSSALGDAQSLSDIGVSVTFDVAQGLESELALATAVSEDVQDETRVERQEAEFFWRLRWRF